ncbi:MAG: hypothetical protein ABIG36_14805, partial [Pseudomonadota bacterium]
RFYSPQLGRWASRDPIAERGSIPLLIRYSSKALADDFANNINIFAENSPIDGIDYLGLDCVTQRAKLYDFTITTHRTERQPKPWLFTGSDSQGYNKFVGYIYVCHWQRLVNVKGYVIKDRFYAYFWETICVCPNSYDSGIDSGHEHSEKLISDQDIIETTDTQVASSIFSGPGTGDALCQSSGQPP